MEILNTIWTTLTTENEILIFLLSIPFCFVEALLTMIIFTTFFNISSSEKQKLIYVIIFFFIRCFNW